MRRLKTGKTLINYFPVIVAKMPEDVEEAVRKGAEMIAESAKGKAPTGSGKYRGSPNLRDSIDVRKVEAEEFGKRQLVAQQGGNSIGIPAGMANQVTAYTVEADARSPKRDNSGNIPYALMVEFGTQSGAQGPNSPQPFMVPAFEEKRQEIIDMVSDQLGEIL